MIIMEGMPLHIDNLVLHRLDIGFHFETCHGEIKPKMLSPAPSAMQALKAATAKNSLTRRAIVNGLATAFLTCPFWMFRRNLPLGLALFGQKRQRRR